jgi:hypothetical protein
VNDSEIGVISTCWVNADNAVGDILDFRSEFRGFEEANRRVGYYL